MVEMKHDEVGNLQLKSLAVVLAAEKKLVVADERARKSHDSILDGDVVPFETEVDEKEEDEEVVVAVVVVDVVDHLQTVVVTSMGSEVASTEKRAQEEPAIISFIFLPYL